VTCVQHPGVTFHSETDCFVCQPSVTGDNSVSYPLQPDSGPHAAVAEMVASGHWPQPGVQGPGRNVA
jgi:hypothetical protein